MATLTRLLLERHGLYQLKKNQNMLRLDCDRFPFTFRFVLSKLFANDHNIYHVRERNIVGDDRKKTKI